MTCNLFICVLFLVCFDCCRDRLCSVLNWGLKRSKWKKNRRKSVHISWDNIKWICVKFNITFEIFDWKKIVYICECKREKNFHQVRRCAYAVYRSIAHQTNWEHIVTMAIRIKSQVYTVIFSIIILIVLDNWGSIAAQQQQQQQPQQQQQQQSPQQTKGKKKIPINFRHKHTKNWI